MVKYAEVVVNAPVRYRRVMPDDAYPEERDTLTGYSPLGLTFHYSIPPRLEAEISLGQLVWIPFGRHRLQGVVMAFDDQSPVAETKDIYSIVDPEPVLSPPQIELARWISRYYHAPLIDTVLMMVPPGVDRKVEVFVELSPDVDIPENLTSRQRAIVEFLRGRSKTRLSVLGRSVGRKGWRSAVDQLVRKGLVCKWSELEEPRVKPKTERFVELVAGEGAIEEKLPHLGHSSKQADLLQILAHHRDPLPSVQDLCRMADCTEAPLRSLQEKGMVEITGRRHLVASLVPSQTIDQVINDQLSNAPMQAATMTYLQDQAAPVEATRLYEEVGTSSAVLRTLEKKGLLQRFEEEPQVLLTLPPEELPAQLISLRGAEKHVMVLKLLRECGGALEVGEVCAQVECSPGLIKELEDQGLVRVEEHEVWRDPLEGRTFASTKPPRLTPDQEAAYKAISAALDGDRIPSSRIFLLHGVTGSGKTEIYLRMLADVLEKGRQAIVLVPEIALTPQTIRRFAARFPGHIAVLHSKLSLGERYDEWRRIRMGKVDVVIGSRSAIFAPLPRLGLIVLDEEHEWTYKQESTPRYHAHHVAIKLAELTGAVVILGSATPDVISYYRARRGEYQLLHLPQRIMGHRRQIEEQRARFQIPDSGLRVREVGPEYEDARYMDLPPVQIVDLRQELRAGNTSIFSRALQDAMTVALAAGEQVILFLNRRGTATFIQCRDCGFVLKCQRCDIPLTYHGAADDLVCHHCNRRTFVPSQCPSCWSGRIKFFGIGTQKVEQVTRQFFPEARIVRWDRDTTGGKLSHEQILEKFIEHQADVMIGTQMVAKGLDLPLVTLVGVVTADTALHLPDFRASERTFQLLTQVAGRAGRSILGGKVIIQTYTPEHYCIQAASRHDYRSFYEQEIAFRREQGYPPFNKLTKLVYLHANPQRCQEEAEKLHRVLRNKIARLGLPAIDLIGPAPCFLSRIRGRYRWQIILRTPDPHALLENMPIPLGWRVDVDPVSLL